MRSRTLRDYALRTFVVPIFLVVIGGLWERHRLLHQRIIWDGPVELTVRVEPNGFAPCRLRAMPIPREEEADEVEADFEGWYRRDFGADIADFKGDPFRVFVMCGGRTNGLGDDLGYRQHRLMALWIYRDGLPRKRVIVSLPDVRKVHELTVELP